MKKWIYIVGGAALLGAGLVAGNAMIKPELMVPAAALATHEVGPGFFTVAVKENADPASFDDLAGIMCLDVDKCMLGIWLTGEEPSALPFTEAQIKAQAFAYTINRETGFERVAWDCSRYSNTPREKCLAK